MTDCLIGSIHYFTTGLHGFHVLVGSFLSYIILLSALFYPLYFYIPFYFIIYYITIIILYTIRIFFNLLIKSFHINELYRKMSFNIGSNIVFNIIEYFGFINLFLLFLYYYVLCFNL